MSVKHEVVWTALALLVAPAASAEKLGKESKKWLEDEIAAIIVPSEEKFFKDMKEADRLEFQKIFWSRRDPSNDTPKPENDFKTEYLKKKGEADLKFRAPGRTGAATDCGKTYILLGEPDQKQQGMRGEAAPGMRNPESWIYKDKPSLPVRIKAGQLQVEFDEACQFAEGSRFREQLTRIAEGKITRPGLDYRVGKDGRLVKLVDLLPKPTQAQLLLKEPRQDFAAGADIQFLKTSDGGTALVGVIHGRAEGLTTVDLAGKKAVKVTIAAQAIDESGRLGTNYEQATVAPVAADGSFSASYRLGLKPGKYNLRVAVLDESTKKGSVAEKPADVPDLNTGELSAASLIAVREIEEGVQNSDPAHPFSAYLLGSARLVPFSGLPLSKSDSLNIFYQYYDAKLNEATGKASVVASLQIFKGDKPVARAADAPFDLQVGGTVVGPVPLEKYEPGTYTVKLKVTDNVAKRDVTRELSFEIPGARSVPAPGPAPADPTPTPSTGTGFFVSRNGYLLTCHHVIQGARVVTVRYKEKTYPATVVKADPANDVALLKVEGQFPALPLGDSNIARQGQQVATTGFPQLDIQGFAPKFTRGDVSSVEGLFDDARFFQVSVPIQPGNSGGPLVDEQGNVIGLVTSTLAVKRLFSSRGTIPQNVNYALKIGYAKLLIALVRASTSQTEKPGSTSLGFTKVAELSAEAVALITTQP